MAELVSGPWRHRDPPRPLQTVPAGRWHQGIVILGRSVRPELKFPKNLDLLGAFSIFSLEKSIKQMRLIDSARGVDAICGAGSWNRISIRDSVNCQSREQIEKINGSIDFLTNILSFSTKKCLQNQWKSWKIIKNHQKIMKKTRFFHFPEFVLTAFHVRF